MRENAESIAFYSGSQREAELAGARLARVIATVFGKARAGGKRGVAWGVMELWDPWLVPPAAELALGSGVQRRHCPALPAS